MNKYEILFRLEAYLDLEEIESYYNRISFSLTNSFFGELYKTLSFIENQPNIFQEDIKQ